MFGVENLSALLTRPLGPNILKLINPVSKLQAVFQEPMKIQTATSSWVRACVCVCETLLWPDLCILYYSIIFFAVLFTSFYFWQFLFIWSPWEMGFSKEQFLARLQVYFSFLVLLVPTFSFLVLYFTFSRSIWSGYSLFCFYIHFSCSIATIQSLLCTWLDWK